MSNTGTFSETVKTAYGKARTVCGRIGGVIGQICTWIFRLRKVIMAIPVVYLAVRIAIANMERLPEYVGLNLQSSGEFAMMVTRGYAVLGPLCVTAFCLLLMFCSRKTLFPWIISIFTLIVPYLIYLTNLYAF
ncbi:MAG: hypothetical protein IKT52_06475 [Oscillospiraceae bacterium]|nr:hypothetical protein [Oscillospiraceae bacterium]